MPRTPARSSAVTYTVVGASVALVGAGMTVVFFLQPWRTCPEDDVAAGCVALPQDTAGMVIGFFLLIGGLILLAAGVSRRGGR